MGRGHQEMRQKKSRVSIMAKYAQIEDLKNGEIYKVLDETDGEVYFYDWARRWCYFNKSEEGVHYIYIPAGQRRKPPKEKQNKVTFMR